MSTFFYVVFVVLGMLFAPRLTLGCILWFIGHPVLAGLAFLGAIFVGSADVIETKTEERISSTYNDTVITYHRVLGGGIRN